MVEARVQAIGGSSQILQHIGLQPFTVAKQRAKRARDLPMLIAFGTGRARSGIPQNITQLFDKLRLAIERMVQFRCMSNSWHDATYPVSHRRDAGVPPV